MSNGVTITCQGGNRESKSVKPFDGLLLEPAEVLDIILNEQHADYIKPDISNNNIGRPIGTIKFRRFITDKHLTEGLTLFAIPLSPYIKIYPIKHEIVSIYRYPGKSSGEFENVKTFYYDNVVNVHNLTNSNELPYSTTSYSKEKNKTNDYSEFNGVSKTVDNKEIKLGETFVQNTKITELQPFEGDLIYQGRWGNTIRFGSTVTKLSNKNEWSNRGEDGDPLMIIQTTKDFKTNPPNYRTEKINENSACIYLCDGQLIPLSVASTNLKAFEDKPELPKSRENKQVIISSDRIVINGGPADRKGDVMIFGKQFISLSSAGTVNIQADKEIILVPGDNKELRLGHVNATERAVLGDALKKWSSNLIDELSKHIHPTGTGPSGTPTPDFITKMNSLKQKFETDVLSKIVKIK